MMENSRSANWKSRTGFLLVIMGSAVGLGNVWRFPFIAYRYGGGSFLIPYVIAVFTVGVPLMILELGVGHRFRASAPLAFSRIGRRWEMLGWWMVVVGLVGVGLYYCVVISWCVNYLFLSRGLGWGTSVISFYEKSFLNISSGPYSFAPLGWSVVLGLFFVWLVSWFVVFKGMRRVVEIVSMIFMPLLAGLILILLAWSLTLPGAIDGLNLYIKPDLGQLVNPAIWADAFSQVFYSFSIGFGIVITYASYLPSKTDIKTNAFISCISNACVALVAGMVVFATLGFMSFSMGKPLMQVAPAGPGLIFTTYPELINNLPIGREFVAGLFFLTLIFAGIASLVSLMESASMSIMDKFGYSRKKAASFIAFFGFFGSSLFATGAGLYWLDAVDYFVNHFGLLTAGFFEAIAIGWVYRSAKLEKHVREVSTCGSLNKSSVPKSFLNKCWKYLIAIWIPLVLGALIIFEFIKQIRQPYSEYGWLFVLPVGFGWIIMMLVIAWYLKSRGWKTPPVKEAGLL